MVKLYYGIQKQYDPFC